MVHACRRKVVAISSAAGALTQVGAGSQQDGLVEQVKQIRGCHQHIFFVYYAMFISGQVCTLCSK
jgi:hypothetical protein